MESRTSETALPTSPPAVAPPQTDSSNDLQHSESQTASRRGWTR